MQIELKDRWKKPVWYAVQSNYRGEQPAAMVGARFHCYGMNIQFDDGHRETLLPCGLGLRRMLEARRVIIEEYGSPGIFSLTQLQNAPRGAEFIDELRAAGGCTWLDVDDDCFTPAWVDLGVRELLYSWHHQRSAVRISEAQNGQLRIEIGHPLTGIAGLMMAARAALYTLPSEEELRKAEEEGCRPVLAGRQDMLRAADRVICATEELARRVRPYNRNTVTLPNVASVPERPPARSTDGVVRVGYSLGPSHRTDLPLALPALLEVGALPNVELHFFGLHPIHAQFSGDRLLPSGTGEVNGVRFVFHALDRSFKTYLENVGMLDVAVMPLENTGFNLARSPQKWFEHSVHETATVVSDSPVYACVKDGETGLKAKTPGDFKRLLRQLVEDAELRRRIGAAAREDVLQHYTAETLGEVWRAGMRV